MKELLTSLQSWISQEKPFALARVISTWGSSPRPVGSSMLVSDKMEMVGSVSGGCVEGAVVKAAQDFINNSGGEKLSFGISDEDAWTVGLSCGGKVEVFIEQFMAYADNADQREVWDQLEKRLDANESCLLVTKLASGENFNTLILPDRSTFGTDISAVLIDEALNIFNQRKNGVIEFEGSQYFAHVFPRRSQLLIIGAAHITADLVQLGKMFDFEVIVIDPRGAFAQKTYFKVAPDQIIEKYPSEVLPEFTLDAYTYAAILSHDPKIDDNALQILLPANLSYIGALGSRKTHAKRIERLKALGFSEEIINEKIDAPIGMDIKAKTPREIALSIMGEIIKAKNVFY
ncbi:XdhC family protein [Fulvivirgaceae bacterium BMA12]|uniref:XdhC family protein n=1 Tax=Agaribacillus aureus TaxID=3051825 RepID=A0ABT8LG19_9BACT|nr:XdhC family protein [Fulvivirgaceae bacterium BMA12]